MSQIHPLARTTPRTRTAIKNSVSIPVQRDRSDSGNVTGILANVTGTAVYAVGLVLRINEARRACSFDAFCKELHARLQDQYAQTQRRPASQTRGWTHPSTNRQ